MPHAIVSIHDVMPHTMAQITAIIAQLDPFPKQQIALLVVPGLDWQPAQIKQLHQWQQAGFELAGHGWRHVTDDIHTVYHKLHSRLISRDVAEHLSLTSSALRDLIQRNFAWFAQHDFVLPDLYVPPAWAMGNVSRSQLAQLPFRYYENSGGLLDGVVGRHRRLPLIGFEADNKWRTDFLRRWNALNWRMATAERPVRISIHPYDYDLRLGDTIMPYLNQITVWHNYRSVF